MFIANAKASCQVIKKVTDDDTTRCLRPAEVVLILNVPAPVVICLECAKELLKELQQDLAMASRTAITMEFDDE